MSVPYRGTGAGTWTRWGQRSTPVVTGFPNSNDQVRGRPVGLAIDKSGALLFADDVGNTVWRVTSASSSTASR